MSPAEKFDLVILGSGSTAFAAALRAAGLGKTAAMTEERTLGGTCVNRGCVPSKNLIEAARIVHESRKPRYPGLSSASMSRGRCSCARQGLVPKAGAVRNTRGVIKMVADRRTRKML